MSTKTKRTPKPPKYYIEFIKTQADCEEIQDEHGVAVAFYTYCTSGELTVCGADFSRFDWLKLNGVMFRRADSNAPLPKGWSLRQKG